MPEPHPRRWLALVALGLSMMAVGLDMTVLNTALPTLATDLHASNSQLQWFVDGYNLVLAAAVLPAGLLGDRMGRRKMLIAGLLIFGAGSTWCALSTSAGELIAARVLLGLGAAVLLPLAISVLTVLFEPQERQRAIAMMSIFQMIGIPLGPIVAGAILQHFAWGWVFALNIPLVIVGLVAMAALMPAMPGSHRGKIDMPGIALSTLGLVGLTYGLIQGPADGWNSPQVLGALIAGVALLAALVLVERCVAHPLLDLSLFSDRSFTSGATLATVLQFGMLGVMFVLPQFFQAVLGADALGTGLRTLPAVAGLLVGMQLSTRLVGKLGTTRIMTAGFLLLAVGAGLGAGTGPHTGFGFVAAFSAVFGLGLGVGLPTAMVTATNAFSKARAGIGSSMLMELRNFGGVIGIAVLGSVLSAGYHAGLPSGASAAVRSSAAAGVAVARRLDSPNLLAAVRSAFTGGMGATLWVCAGLAVVGIVIAIVMRDRPAAEPRERGESKDGEPVATANGPA